jgi:hypothetical protein
MCHENQLSTHFQLSAHLKTTPLAVVVAPGMMRWFGVGGWSMAVARGCSDGGKCKNNNFRVSCAGTINFQPTSSCLFTLKLCTPLAVVVAPGMMMWFGVGEWSMAVAGGCSDGGKCKNNNFRVSCVMRINF